MTEMKLVLQQLQRMNSRLEGLEQESKQHSQIAGDNQTQLLELGSKVGEISAHVGEVRQDLGAVKSDLGVLGGQVEMVGTQVTQLQGQVQLLSDRVELLSNRVEVLNERVEDLETDRRSARRVANLGGAMPYRGPAMAPMGAGFTERAAQYQRPSPFAQ